MFTTEAQRSNLPNIWPGIREQNTFALWSHMDCIWRWAMGFGKVLCGWETYGWAWCYVTLNPHHLPGGPGVPSLPASDWFQHHWSSVIHGFLISPPSLSLVPITRHARVQISCINNCGSPSQIGSTEEEQKGPEKPPLWMWEGRCRGIAVPGVCWQEGPVHRAGWELFENKS